MNAGSELEADLQSQASSPAQDKSEEGGQEGIDRGEQPTQVSVGDEQNEGEQAGKDRDAHIYMEGGSSDERTGEQPAQFTASNEYKDESVLICVEGEQRGSSDSVDAGEHSSDKRGSSDEDAGEQPAQFTASDEYIEDERRGSSDEAGGEQLIEADSDELADEQASQWLKAILPEMTNGWWDVYPKGRGFAVKFCWRDQERQTLTFPRISYEQFQTLKQSDPNEVGKSTHGQISAHLHSLSLNSARRDKALIVAQKLGINLDEY